MKSLRRGPDINRVLLTALEALYRCVRPDCVLLAFPDTVVGHIATAFERSRPKGG